MKTKICSKCKIKKEVSCFTKQKDTKDEFRCWCKLCVKQYSKQYSKNNALLIAKQQKQYREDNTSLLLEYQKQWYKNNMLNVAKRQKPYKKYHNKNNALFKSFSEKLKIFEEIRQCPENLKLLEVKCAYCGKWMLPTNRQVNHRLQAFNGTITGEQRFYCSENCKISCPTYGQMKYPKDFKKATSREVVPLLRQLVLKRDNYTCQKCGATIETAQLHVHHEKSYTLNKIMANDPDNCITFCKKCHKYVHSQEGCRYADLKCK